MAAPSRVNKFTFPEVAPDGTVAVMDVADWIVKVAGVPLKSTSTTPPSVCPEIVTSVPIGPLFGATKVINGYTVKPGEIAVPPGVVIVNAPDDTLEGTVAVI